MNQALTRASYDDLLRRDFASFARRSFVELNPQTRFLLGWHVEIIAAKLAAVFEGRIRRLIINLPPRHLKSHLASVAPPISDTGKSATRPVTPRGTLDGSTAFGGIKPQSSGFAVKVYRYRAGGRGLH